MRKSLLALAVLGTLNSGLTYAEEAAPATTETPPYTIAYNVGLFSQYIFRGLTQTGGHPAIQGGIDFTHSSGFYAGAWGSNISWLEDAKQGGAGYGYNSASLELDLYGGYRNTIKDVTYDIGLLQYVYPGTPVAGQVRAETTEVYGSLGYKWVTGKVSYVVSNDAFGFAKQQGTYYADLTANYPLTDTITLTAHVGRQEYDKNDAIKASYTDWKLGASKAFANGVTVGGYYTDTNGDSFAYGGSAYAGGNIATATGTVFVQKTF